MCILRVMSERITQSGEGDPPPPRRINVAINPAMLAAIDLIIERESVTLTEAVRRLCGYGEFVYRAVKEDGSRVLLERKDGTVTEVVIL